MSDQLSWNIIKRFSRKRVMVFGFKDVAMEFPGKSNSVLTRALASMVLNGMLCKIARDIYYVVPLGADPERYEPDGRLVAKFLMQDVAYYVGYTSALRIHGLSPNDSAKVYVVAEKQVKPVVRKIGGTTFQFIRYSSDRIFGYRDIWINQLDQVKVSDLEKTIVDMASSPLSPGRIIELGKAIFQAINRIDYNLLFYYFARNGNRTAIKRYLYLVDLLELEWNSGHDLMMEELGSGATVSDSQGIRQGIRHGRNIGKFGLKINVDAELLKKEALSI